MSLRSPTPNIARPDILKDFLYLFIMDLVAVPLMNYSDYEKGEPNYAAPFLEAYIMAFKEKADGLLSHELIKKINKVSLHHSNSEHAGEYKKKSGFFIIAMKEMFAHSDSKGLTLGVRYNATDAGIREFINYWIIKNDTHVLEFTPKASPDVFNCAVAHEGKAILFKVNKGKVEKNIFNMERDLPFILSKAHDLNYHMKIYSHVSRDDGKVQASTHQHMSELIEEYNKKIKLLKSDDDKLKFICKTIQLINQLHPFTDGNIRTCVILLNKLLRDNHLKLSLLLNPNRLDCCHLEDIISMVKEGQEIFSNLMSNTNAAEFIINVKNEKYPQLARIRCLATNMNLDSLLDQFIKEVINSPAPLLANIHQDQPFLLFNPEKDVNGAEMLAALTLLTPPVNSSVIDAINTRQYSLALRRTCAANHPLAVKEMLSFSDKITFDIDEKSSNGKTALEWFDAKTSESTLKHEVRKLLILTAKQNKAVEPAGYQ